MPGTQEKLLTLQSEQRKELSGFDQMERELQTAAANVEAILHAEIVPVNRTTRNTPELQQSGFSLRKLYQNRYGFRRFPLGPVIE